GQGHHVVTRQAATVGDYPGDVIGADIRRGRIACAAVTNTQVLAIDAGVERGSQVGGKVGSAAVVMAVVTNSVADGLLVHRQLPVSHGHHIVANQSSSVGDHPIDLVGADVSCGGVAVASIIN